MLPHPHPSSSDILTNLFSKYCFLSLSMVFQICLEEATDSVLSEIKCKGWVSGSENKNEQPARLAWLIVLTYTSGRSIQSPWKKKREFFKSSIDFATNQINYSTSVNPAEIHSRVWCTCFCEENVTFHIGVVSHQRDTQLNKQLTLHSKRWTKVDMTWAEQSSVENRLPLYAWRTAYCFLQGNKGSFLRIAAPPWFQPNWNQRKIS